MNSRRTSLPTFLLAVSSLLLVFPFLLCRAQAPDSRPLSKSIIITYLEAGIEPAQVERHVWQYGVSFKLTPGTESELRKAGASEELLEAVRGFAAPDPSHPERFQHWVGTWVFDGKVQETKYCFRGPGEQQAGKTSTSIPDFSVRVISISESGEAAAWLIHPRSGDETGNEFAISANPVWSGTATETSLVLNMKPVLSGTRLLSGGRLVGASGRLEAHRQEDRYTTELGYRLVWNGCERIDRYYGSMTRLHSPRPVLTEEACVQQHLARAEELEQQFLYSQAEQEYRAALEHDPEDPDLHLALGHNLSRQEVWDEAIPQLRRAVGLKPDSAEAHVLLGFALGVSDHDLDESIRESRLALRLKPDYAAAHAGIAHILEKRGDFDAAIAELREVIRLGPSPWYWGALGDLLLKAGDVDGAIAAYEEMLRLRPNEPWLHRRVACAFYEKGDVQRALAQFVTAYEVAPDDLKSMFRLGPEGQIATVESVEQFCAAARIVE